jgi:anti-sigma factor RsiW
MKYNIEELIDRYFDGQLSPTEQTAFLSQVAGDPVAKQLFDAETFIRGAFTHDVSAVPQAAMEPSASLLAKLSATKPLASQAVTQATQEVTRETVTHTVASQATTVAVKGTSAVTGKVAVGTLATAGKTIMGLSVGAFQFVAGAVVTIAIATGVIVSTNNSTPDQQVATPVADSANVFTIDNKIDTPITVSSSPVTPIETRDSRAAKSEPTTVASDKPAPYEPGDPMKDLPEPRMNQDPVVKPTINTKATDK